MIRIIHYILKMLPYMIMVIPIFVIVRLIYYKLRKNKNISLKRELLILLLIMFITGLLSVALTGHYSIHNVKLNSINIIPFRIIYDTYKEVFLKGNINYLLISFLGNIVMFIPIGLLSSMIWNLDYKKVILFGFLLSLFIEVNQLFLVRETDVDDLIFNTFGTYLGILIYRRIE